MNISETRNLGAIVIADLRETSIAHGGAKVARESMVSVTVVIPTFNRYGFLLEALSSVFAQTFQDYELVVVDDGSTDNTQAGLQPFASRIRYIWKAHGGEASARNRGIREARASLIAFLDSDDLWEPTFLSSTVAHFACHPHLGLVSTGCVTLPDGAHRPRIRTPLLQGDLFATLFLGNFITTSAVVVKRECFQTVGLFNEKLDQAEDYDLWLRIAGQYPVALLNQPLCRWRSHPGNISRNELRHRQCEIQVVESYCNDPRIPGPVGRVRRSKLQVSLGRAYLKLGQVENAKPCFRDAIGLTPYRVRPWRYWLVAWLLEKARSFFDRSARRA